MKAITVKSAFKILTIAVGVTVFSACSNGGNKLMEDVAVSSVDISEDYAVVAEDQKTEVKTDKPTEINVMIIKTASARYKVKNVVEASEKIKKMAEVYDAYISDLRFENDNYRKEMRFVIKVPAKYFDILMDSVGGVSEFTDFENITTKDVTEDYVDLASRLKTKVEVKERYESILKKNAITVEDILATEDKLRIIQEEIESAKGRLNYLTNKVAYSTIEIDLYEPVSYIAEPETYSKSFWSKTKEGLVFGWDLISSIVIGMIYIWPILILGILIFLFFRFRRQRRK